MEIIIKITIDGDEVKVEKVETEKETVPVAEMTNHTPGEYARFFDEICMGWTKDPEYNLMYLIAQQRYANEMLEHRGHLFLNEVYDMLDIPRTKAGAMVGWIYNEHSGNKVDFGIYNERNADFVNGHKNTALLDFNVDGNILDYI